MSTITKGLFVTATVSATCAIFTTIAAAQRQVSAPAVTRADPARFLVEGNSEPDWLMAERALDDPTPWGKPSQGLACRLLLNGDYCDGEPVHAIVEVRNVSDAEISIPNVFDFDSKSVARLQVVGPDGKAVKTRQYESWDDSNFGPARFATLEPGQLKRAHFPDIRQHLEGRLATRGEYRLTYWHFGASRIRGARAKELAARSWKGTLKSNTVTLNRRPLRKEDLAVHEWGVFSVTSNLSHVNAGRKQEWESLPAYFYRQFPTWRLHWIPSAWDKPIVYFHSTRPQLQLEVSVDFPKGAPVVWWPACSKPFDDTPGRRPSPDRTGPLFRALHWSVHLGRWHPFSAGGRSLGGFRERRCKGCPKIIGCCRRGMSRRPQLFPPTART